MVCGFICKWYSLIPDVRQAYSPLSMQAHHSPLSNETETRLTKILRTELNVPDAQVAEVLGPVSPIFRKLLSSTLTQDHNSFRTMWNVTFGRVELSEQEIPEGLLPLLLERWHADNTAFDMPAWTKAKEESQAARVGVTTMDYEADNSDHVGESQRSFENERSRMARNSRYLETSLASSSSVFPAPPDQPTAAIGKQAATSKRGTVAKRTAKKSRKRSRTSEPKEEEDPASFRHVSLRSEDKGSRETAGECKAPPEESNLS